MRLMALGILALAGSVASGQVQQFAFAHTDTMQARQEIRNIISTVAEIPQVAAAERAMR
jgi:hypothetical protein